ncbi:MAG TPA: hypothetical protein VHB79_17380 [Polyangiaceae bacterium]|nr:hypothetical protein [Polyangiaceae bacterium]
MAELATNRDLYCFIADLVRDRAGCSLTLQGYLETLRRLGSCLSDRDAVSVPDFARLLSTAFEPGPSADHSRSAASAGYPAWERRIAEQIRDLDEMREAGTLEHEHRYLGIDAPRGGRWYNFDPCTYLECAAAGTFGGWQEGDDTGRSYVPGPVAVLDAAGAITSVDPRDIENPLVALRPITWEMFADFLNAGQWYE